MKKTLFPLGAIALLTACVGAGPTHSDNEVVMASLTAIPSTNNPVFAPSGTTVTPDDRRTLQTTWTLNTNQINFPQYFGLGHWSCYVKTYDTLHLTPVGEDANAPDYLRFQTSYQPTQAEYQQAVTYLKANLTLPEWVYASSNASALYALYFAQSCMSDRGVKDWRQAALSWQVK